MAKGSKVSMGDILRDEVPDSDVVPDGGYLASIANMEVTQTGNNAKTPGAKMFKVQYSIKEPKEYKGVPLFDNFVIGNEDDPDATKTSTWKASRGAKALKKLLTAAQVPLEGEEEDICDAAKSQAVFLVVVCQEQQEGDYKGTLQNRIRGYYAEGEREPEVSGEVPTSSKKKPLREAIAPKKRVVEAEEDEDDEDEEDEEETSPKKRGRPAGSKNKPKDEEDEEEDDDEEDEDEDEDEEEAPPKAKRRA